MNLKNQIPFLRVKIKSLAAEARIIRQQERQALKGKKPQMWQYLALREHRRTDVRNEQRCSLLAYAYLRGVPFLKTEHALPASVLREPNWKRVRQIVEKFGGPPGRPIECTAEALQEWRNATVAV